MIWINGLDSLRMNRLKIGFPMKASFKPIGNWSYNVVCVVGQHGKTEQKVIHLYPVISRSTCG
ncbi:MAG: hypothetical protein RXR43_15365 [Sulfolobus sp.]